MSLFKINRGKESDLPENYNDGWIYFCTDTGSFLIDHIDDSTDSLVRSKISAKYADILRFEHNGEIIELYPQDIIEMITTDDIDRICGATIYSVNEVTF